MKISILSTPQNLEPLFLSHFLVTLLFYLRWYIYRLSWDWQYQIIVTWQRLGLYLTDRFSCLTANYTINIFIRIIITNILNVFWIITCLKKVTDCNLISSWIPCSENQYIVFALLVSILIKQLSVIFSKLDSFQKLLS